MSKQMLYTKSAQFVNEIINFANGFKITSILILLVGVLNLETLKRYTPLRVLFCLILISLATDIAGSTMRMNGIHNIWLFNIYNLVEYSLFALFYLTLFKLSKEWKLAIGVGYSLVLGIMIITTVSQSFYEHLNSASMAIKSIILICSSVYYFRVMLSKLEFNTPWMNPLFWINSGILLYFSGAFFIFTFSDYRDAERMITLWDIHNIIHIIYNLLILIGFWKARKI